MHDHLASDVRVFAERLQRAQRQLHRLRDRTRLTLLYSLTLLYLNYLLYVLSASCIACNNNSNEIERDLRLIAHLLSHSTYLLYFLTSLHSLMN